MFSRKQKYLAIFPAFFLLAGIVLAQAGSQWFQVSKGNNNAATATINKHGVCKGVKNKSTSKDIFVPVNTSGEWSSFRSNAPSSIVEFGDCLVNSSHDVYDCAAAGGTVTTTGTNKFCKFISSSCPVGWSQYNNWSKTVADTCNGGGGTCLVGSDCTTGFHGSFQNSAPETCTYSDDKFGVIGCVTKTCTADIVEIGCY